MKNADSHRLLLKPVMITPGGLNPDEIPGGATVVEFLPRTPLRVTITEYALIFELDPALDIARNFLSNHRTEQPDPDSACPTPGCEHDKHLHLSSQGPCLVRGCKCGNYQAITPAVIDLKLPE